MPSISERLAIRGLAKHFGATRALTDVDLSIRSGTVHALLGHNGSGKSTLIKILDGYYVADSGKISINGEDLPHSFTARLAYDRGIRFVHQDLGLFSDLSVAENLALGTAYARSPGGTISWRRERRLTSEALRRFGLKVPPRHRVSSLGPVERTLLAIARATLTMQADGGLLVLDEPTARLPPSESEQLLRIIRSLRDHGTSVLYVTHRLAEVFEIADRVTVLQDGKVVMSDAVSASSEREISQAIIGRRQHPRGDEHIVREPATTAARPAVVRLQNLSGRRVRNVDLVLRTGELLAVTGTVGSGRSELGRLIYGLQRPSGGSIAIGQVDGWTRHSSPAWSSRHAVGYVPQERSDGLAVGETVADNVAVTSYRSMSRWFGVSNASLRQVARKVIESFSVRPGRSDIQVGSLSGGNQQKVAIGKWSRLSCDLLILDEPLQGIDVGAKADIMEALRERVLDRGGAVLWIESDAEIVPRYADRAIIMRDGQITAEFDSTTLDRDSLLDALYAVGGVRS